MAGTGIIAVSVSLHLLLTGATPPAATPPPATAPPVPAASTSSPRAPSAPSAPPAAAPSSGSGRSDPLASPADTLEVNLLAGVWLPRLNGLSALGGGAELDLALDYDLNAMETVFNAELTIRRGEALDVLISGFDFSANGLTSFPTAGSFGPVAIAPGDTVQSHVDLTSVGLELGFNIWRPYTKTPEVAARHQNRTSDGRFIADLRLTPLAGLRYLNATQSVANLTTANAASASGDWLAFYAGFQMTLDYRPDVSWMRLARVQGSIGLGPALGDDGGFMWQVRAGLSLHPIEQVGLEFGYRLLELDVESDGWTFNGGLQGLYLAGSIRF